MVCSTLCRMSDNKAQLAEAIAALLAATSAAVVTPPPPETVLTVEEAAERLKVSKTLLYRAIGDGEIRSIRIGKRRLIPSSEITRLIGSTA